ncbi:MAG: ATP-binding cassette domain-containing protein [Rhodothermia bacterium]
MLTLSNVVKSFGVVEAVSGLDLAIGRGETTVLIGPSGCGKSTLLRMMNGLVAPDSGEVRWLGERLAGENLAQIRHRQGYVIQEGGLFPHLSARDNVSLLVGYLGWGLDRIEARLGELAGLTQLPLEALDRYPRELSGGQRQRVSLMRALMPDPELLLLDEPLGSLDPMIRADLQVDLRHIFENLNKTVVLVTHDLAEADYFSDTIVLMRRGMIVQIGSIAELASEPADPFVSSFIEAQRRLRIQA